MAESTIKCACRDCNCTAPKETGFSGNDGTYCSDACAERHRYGTGCGHDHCNCTG